jgi:hypothetical protein
MREGDMSLELRSQVVLEDARLYCRTFVRAAAPAGSWLAVVVRPYNPEGVSFVNRLATGDDGPGWRVDDKRSVRLDKKPAAYLFSDYERGDVFGRFFEIPTPGDSEGVRCKVGMASSAALFPVERDSATEMRIDVPLDASRTAVTGWSDALADACRLDVPDKHYKFLFETAVYSLVLHSPEDVYPGPYMYRRFWFRDAAFILNAMTCVNLAGRAERVLDRFSGRQTPAGYFLSQNGEWDSNGQALWILERFAAMSGRPAKREWRNSVLAAASWIVRKREKKDGTPHSGLLPAGFSAEHFGPSDHYYWDDFGAAAGPRAAATMARAWGDTARAREFEDQALDLLDCVDRALHAARRENNGSAVPATPYRRLDGGSIGALVTTYPLQLWYPGDARLSETIEFLMKNFMIRHGFYQEIGHAGINAYLSLHIAQAFLRAGDRRFEPIVRAVADLASPTGQWPEAVHPRTGGGCMGDGQHIWAAAEWVLMMRNWFVREEEKSGTLVIGSGIPRAWLDSGEPLFIGPVRTLFGRISVTIRGGNPARVSWQADWHTPPKRISVRLDGCPETSVEAGQTAVEIRGGAA